MTRRPALSGGLLTLACLAGSPTIARAQEAEAGTAVMLMRLSLPDTMAALKQTGLGEMAMRMTYATDGRRVAMQVQFEAAQSVLGVPLDDVLIHAIFDPATDSMKIGLTLPPDMMASLGGGIGFAFAFVLPDTIALPTTMGDSLQVALATAQFSYRDLGTVDTVGGVPCRAYEMVTDSATATVCLARPPAALAAVNRMMERLPLIGPAFQNVSARQRELLGHDDLFTIRMTGAFQGGGMDLELASATSGPPDPGFFTLAAGLGPVPPELLGALMQGAVAATTGAPDTP